MTTFAGPAFYPFSLAALVMAGLVFVEAASLAIGHSASGMIDALLGHDAMHALGGSAETHAVAAQEASPSAWFSWVNVGRVPLLILVILGLAVFALSGFVIQVVAGHVAATLSPGIAALVAGATTVPVLRRSSRVLGRLMPRDESYAVRDDDLLGATAEVILGPIDTGLPGQVRVVDRHGNTHFVRARAAPDASAMRTGEHVLLVDRDAAVFHAIPAPPELSDNQRITGR